MKKQTKKTAATPAKSKGEAKPTANAETVAPVAVRDIGKNCPPMVEGAMRAVRGLFQDAVDATRPLRSATDAETVAPVSFPEWKADAQGIIPAPPIPPPPPVGAKVDPWRDWARRIVSRCGWSWEALEENERQPCSRAIAGWGGAVYWALAHAVKLPPARLDEAAAELEGVLVAAAEKKDCDRFCTVCNLFPETVRRLAEAPAAPPTANASANPATPGWDTLEGLRAELRGVAEGVANLAADKRNNSRARRDAGRKGGKESARQRADAERERILAAAFERIGRGVAAGKSINQAARDATRKGEPLLKSNGEPLAVSSLVRYYKRRKEKGGGK